MKPGELTLLQERHRAFSDSLKRQRELAAQLLQIEPEHRCSRCRRHPDDGGGYSPGRAWCRECENERCRTLYRARRDRQAA
jgi:hypothetical protein